MDQEKIKSAVLRAVRRCGAAVDMLLEGAPKELRHNDDECPLSLLSVQLRSLHVTLRQRLCSCPRIEYLYAATLASKAIENSAAGSAAAALERELQGERERMEKEAKNQEAEVSQLRGQRDELDDEGRQAVAAIRSAAAMRNIALRDASELQQQKLREKLRIMEEELQQLQQQHRQQEKQLRAERRALELQVKAAITEHDIDLTARQEALDDLAAKHAAVLLQLRCERDVRDVLNVRCDAILEERRVEEEQRLAEVQEAFMQDRSARIIQRAWQHYKIKKMLKKAQKKGRKKKGSVAK